MNLLKNTLATLWVTFRNLFRKPVTIQYPRVRRTYSERFRGTFALTRNKETGEENCIGCKLCENICPSQIITVVPEKGQGRNWAREFYLDTSACMYCELCIQVCPTDAIVMLKFTEIAVRDRRELVLDKKTLMNNELCYPASWATGNKLRAVQTPPRKVGEK